DWHWSPEGEGGRLHGFGRGGGNRCVAGIGEHADPDGSGHQLAKETEPLCYHLSGEKIDACGIAVRPREAGDETELDRVFAGAEDDRDRRSRRFGRERGGVCRRGNPAHLTADQISPPLRTTIQTGFRPAGPDGHAPALALARSGGTP